MKTLTYKLTKNNVCEVLENTKTVFSENQDVEITYIFSSSRYNLDKRFEFDVSNLKGKKRIRLIGNGKTKTFIESTIKFGAEDFVREGEFSYYQMPKDDDGNYLSVGSFYIGDKFVQMAQSEEHVISPYYMNEEGKIVEGGYRKWGDRNKFYLDVESVNALDLTKQGEIEIHAWVEWHYNEFHIDRVDLNDYLDTDDKKRVVAVYVNPNERIVTNMSLNLANRRIRLCNCHSVLRLNGGYIYSRKDGKLYVRTCDLDYAKKYEVGYASRLFKFVGFDNVEIRDICFTKTNDHLKETLSYWDGSQGGCSDAYNKKTGRKGFPENAVITCDKLGGLTFENCAVKEIPCIALSLSSTCKNVVVRDNDFTSIGGSALRLGDAKTDLNVQEYLQNVLVTNNYINVTGMRYSENCAIILTRGKDVKITYNTILSSSYTAISVGWSWAVGDFEYGEKVNLINCDISHNYIKSFMTNMLDGGAIYMLGGNAKPSYTGAINFVHNNCIIEDKYTCPENKFFACLYHDGASSNWHDADNVVIHDRNIDGYSARMFVQYWVPDGNAFNNARTDGAASWNVYIKNNHYVNCYKLEEVYQVNLAHVIIDNSRNIFEENKTLYKTLKEALNNPNVVAIMNSTGAKR